MTVHDSFNGIKAMIDNKDVLIKKLLQKIKKEQLFDIAEDANKVKNDELCNQLWQLNDDAFLDQWANKYKLSNKDILVYAADSEYDPQDEYARFCNHKLESASFQQACQDLRKRAPKYLEYIINDLAQNEMDADVSLDTYNWIVDEALIIQEENETKTVKSDYQSNVDQGLMQFIQMNFADLYKKEQSPQKLKAIELLNLRLDHELTVAAFAKLLSLKDDEYLNIEFGDDSLPVYSYYQMINTAKKALGPSIKRTAKNAQKYTVTHRGHIMRDFDTAINDGMRWCVDYNDNYTGEIANHASGVKDFKNLSDAVIYSRAVRAELLCKSYNEKLDELQNDDYIVGFKAYMDK